MDISSDFLGGIVKKQQIAGLWIALCLTEMQGCFGLSA